MSAITVSGDLVHYEVLGRGRPVILVHGWIGSWRYWIPTIQQLQMKYRVYAIDLFGFGDSSKNAERYSLKQQVDLLDKFMSDLGLPKAAVIGHGLGALVCSTFAAQNPDKVARMLIAGTPLFDPGDLSERNPAGHRVLLTSDLAARAATLEALKSPISPPSTSAATSTTDSTDDSADENDTDNDLSDHEKPTIIRIDKDARARLEEAARAAGAARMNPSYTDDEIVISPEDTIAEMTIPSALNRPMMQSAPTAASATSENGRNHLKEALGNATLEGLLGKCFKKSEPEYDKIKVDVDKTDNRVLYDSIANYDAAKMLDTLRTLPMPIVIVHGKNDPIIPEPGDDVWGYLTVGNEEKLVPFQMDNVRHFPMLEAEPFIRLVNEFLETADISKLEVTGRWQRRSR